LSANVSFFFLLLLTYTPGHANETGITVPFDILHYMILNLLRVKQLTVEDMMKRSFAEYYQQKDAPENEKKLEELQKKVATLQDPECPMCAVDLKQYYLTWAELLQKKKDVKVYH